MPVALADSIYDGIWQDTRSDSFFSVKITGDTVLVMSFGEIASYQNALRGAYIGSLPETNDALHFSETPFSVYVKTALFPIDGSFWYWKIDFISRDLARIYRPPEYYPILDSLPPMLIRKML